jgi:carbonic anhydrase
MSELRDAKVSAESHRITGEQPIGSYRFDHDEGEPVLPSGHRLAILTCMDARIEPSKLVGVRGSAAHVIRNAGARATEDAIRSLVLSYQLLGTREWFVVQHSHCGMALLTEDLTRELLHGASRAGSSGVKISVPSAREGRQIHKLALRDQEQSVAADVARIRNHPLVPADVPIYGYIYHVETGRFLAVPNASENAVRSAPQVSASPCAAAR